MSYFCCVYSVTWICLLINPRVRLSFAVSYSYAYYSHSFLNFMTPFTIWLTMAHRLLDISSPVIATNNDVSIVDYPWFPMIDNNKTGLLGWFYLPVFKGISWKQEELLGSNKNYLMPQDEWFLVG